MSNRNYSLAIVGVGPRGQYALECFVSELRKLGRSLTKPIVLFEETEHPGSGPVWRAGQPDGNWSNVTERVLVLSERSEIQFDTVKVPAFPSYHDWAGLVFDTWPEDRIDTFPPRGQIGGYMVERFHTLVDTLIKAGLVTFVQDRVDDVTLSNSGLIIRTQSGNAYEADQVLLTVGHQPTVLDPQMQEWSEQSAQSTTAKLFTQAYPVENIIAGIDGAKNLKVAIRGYGLATIDVLRAFAACYGRFEIDDMRTRSQRYVLTEKVDLQIAPFSLDGLTMGPKPLTPQIDAQFKPSDLSIGQLKEQLSDRRAQEAAIDETFLLDRICPIIVQVFLSLASTPKGSPTTPDQTDRLIRAWIDDQTFGHSSILDTSLPPERVLDELLGMATGVRDITLDYCVGQVWRYCQPTIYAALSHSAIPDDALEKVISIDESLKRYAFGPPAQSLQQLKALHVAGILDLRFLNAPRIETDISGWTLSNGTDTLSAGVMIDAVLNAPKIKDVNSPLIMSLLKDGVLEAVHDDFGVATTSDAFVFNDLDVDVPVAVLGRLSKGTIVGVDAILECFGGRPVKWAHAAVKRVLD